MDRGSGRERDIDWLLLERHFAGECTPEEAAAVSGWVAEDPSRERLVATMRAAWERTGEIPGRARRDASTAWSALAARIEAGEPSPAATTDRPAPTVRLLPVRRRRPAVVAAVRVAASLALVASGGLIWRAVESGRHADSAAGPMQETATARGQRAVVSLGDGTRVVLGVATKLRFPSSFSRTRDVYLDGEAFFEVAHDTRRPFVVHTARATARDIGTKFNVRAYGDAADVAVLVSEGAVALAPARAPASAGAPAASIVLRKADLGRLEPNGTLTVAHDMDVNASLGWTRGELAFDRTPVAEAIVQLNRWFDVDVRAGDSTLARYSLTTSLTNQPFSEAIQLVAAALDARVERRGTSYLLFAKRHAH